MLVSYLIKIITEIARDFWFSFVEDTQLEKPWPRVRSECQSCSGIAYRRDYGLMVSDTCNEGIRALVISSWYNDVTWHG